MEAGSEGESNKNNNSSPAEGSKKPKRQMKTPFQLETLERIYAGMFNFTCKLIDLIVCIFVALSMYGFN